MLELSKKKLFVVKVCNGDLGRYNASLFQTKYIVSPSETSAIHSVLNSDTISVEVVSVFDYVEI